MIEEERQTPLYALDRNQDHVITSSFVQTLENKIYYRNTKIDITYPVTKVTFHPLDATLFCTTSDYFRMYKLDEEISLVKTLVNVRRIGIQQQELFAPLTSFDWNIQDTSLCVTSSVDTTCTIWDMNTFQAKTQLIAHDSDVLDVSFSSGIHIFSSVGLEGSVRTFDTRSLQHSTILYETNAQGLARIEWNKRNPNYIATFAIDSNQVLILDVRVPAIPVYTLQQHQHSISCIQWAPHMSLNLISGGT
jgi:WD repeat-containing protein 68